MAKLNLANAVVVLTGASSGIGRRTALEFAGHGARLLLAARDRSALKEVAGECERLGAEAAVFETDVTDGAAVRRLAEAALARWGRIDVWVNNAGVGAVGSFDHTPLEAHEQVIQTDLLGYLRGAHACVPAFKRQGEGLLVNVLSVGSWAPQPYAVAYSAAKIGLRGFSEALRGELSSWRDIHVCDVYPAFIDTPGLRDGANYTGHRIAPAPPVYGPEHVARAIVRLTQRPRATTTVGHTATLARLAHALIPGYPTAAARLVDRSLRHSPPTAESSGNLFHPPGGERRVEGGWRWPRSRRLAVGGALVAGLGLYLARR